MTNPSIPANLTRDEAQAVREWAERAHAEEVQDAAVAHAARVLLAVLPRPTLADMTPEERAECRWMQADVKGYESRVVIVNPFWEDGLARVMWLHTRMNPVSWKSVTPRPDLPRLEWPGTERPAPALPDGWRLADHPNYGRVIVTSPAPDAYGNVCFVAPVPGFIGNDWHLCPPDELTYIDGPEADQ